MKALHVIIEPGKDGYGVMFNGKGFEGIFSFGTTLNEAKENARVVISELIMHYIDNKEQVPAHLKPIKPETVPMRFSFLLKYYFDIFPYLNLSQLAKKINVNPSLIRQYHKGLTYAGEEQFLKIREGLRFVGKELEAVV